jgi:hypothetical protein
MGRVSRVVQLFLLKREPNMQEDTLLAPAVQLLQEFEILFLDPT